MAALLAALPDADAVCPVGADVAAAAAPSPAMPPGAMVAFHARALPITVGTRGSPLALWQTRAFMAHVSLFCPPTRDAEAFRERAICTSGDRIQDRRLAEIGGKGLFAKEIHEALLDGRVDLAVHSLKDLETELPPGIALGCVLRREDPRDALVLGPGLAAPADADPDDPWAALPRGALVGSSSVRRQSQLLHARPDLRVESIRGQVATRLARVAEGRFDATLLALAGLRRLGLEGASGARAIPAAHMLPASCQGIVGVTCRADDAAMREILAAVTDFDAEIAARAERALLGALDGSCRTPVGAQARRLPDRRVEVEGLVAREDGTFLLRRKAVGAVADAERIGRELGEELRLDAPYDVFA